MMRSLSCSVLAVAGLTACAEDVPTTPSFQADVMPILAANCVRCHSVPQLGGAPEDCVDSPTGPRTCGFRLDSFADTVIDEGDPTMVTDDRVVLGAASIALAIPLRIDDSRDPMPPRFPLGDYERDVLRRWAQSDPPARNPRVDNRAPTASAEITDGATVAIAVTVADDDRDLVVGELRARGPEGDRLIASIRSGRLDLTWPRPTVAGRYELVALLDDGGLPVERAVGSLEVAP